MSLPHLLLVDDSESVLAFEKAALAGHYVVSTAVNGREAVDKFVPGNCDAILMDCNMPVLDGVSVVTALRAVS